MIASSLTIAPISPRKIGWPSFALSGLTLSPPRTGTLHVQLQRPEPSAVRPTGLPHHLT